MTEWVPGHQPSAEWLTAEAACHNVFYSRIDRPNPISELDRIAMEDVEVFSSVRVPTGEKLVGRDALADYMRDNAHRRRVRGTRYKHMIANERFRMDDARHATASRLVLTFAVTDVDPLELDCLQDHIEDLVLCDDGAWRIARREWVDYERRDPFHVRLQNPALPSVLDPSVPRALGDPTFVEPEPLRVTTTDTSAPVTSLKGSGIGRVPSVEYLQARAACRDVLYALIDTDLDEMDRPLGTGSGCQQRPEDQRMFYTEDALSIMRARSENQEGELLEGREAIIAFAKERRPINDQLEMLFKHAVFNERFVMTDPTHMSFTGTICTFTLSDVDPLKGTVQELHRKFRRDDDGPWQIEFTEWINLARKDPLGVRPLSRAMHIARDSGVIRYHNSALETRTISLPKP